MAYKAYEPKTVILYELPPITRQERVRVGDKYVMMPVKCLRYRGTDISVLKAMATHDRNKKRGYYKPNILKSQREDWNKKNLKKWRKKEISTMSAIAASLKDRFEKLGLGK